MKYVPDTHLDADEAGRMEKPRLPTAAEAAGLSSKALDTAVRNFRRHEAALLHNPDDGRLGD